MANVPVIRLNKGKMTPLIDARSDVEAYAGGCRELQNFIPRIYGPVERRPGTKFIANCEDNNIKSHMVPFIFSSEIAYDIEFSDKIINVYFDGTLIEGNIATPYLEADLFQLQFNQSADVMWIVHPDYAPRKLSRVSVSDFSLDKISFENGPFIKRNDLENNDGVTIKATGYTIATATAATNTITITTTTDISSQFPVNHRFYITGSTGNDNAYTVLSSSFLSPTMTIVANENIPDNTNDGEIMVDDATVTLTASSATFLSGHVGALFKLTHKRAKVITKGSTATTGIMGDPIDVKGSWTFTTTGNWGMTVEIQRNEDGTNWETFRSYTSVLTDGQGSRNIQKSDVEEADGVQYRINVISVDGIPGTLIADLTVSDSTQSSIFKITSFSSTTSVSATAIVAAPENGTTVRWAEGSWSDVRGWPTTIAFFEERAIYGFTNKDQQTIWLSGTDAFEDFDAGINDADSFARTVPTSNKGRWISSLDALAVGMSGDEWLVRSSNLDQPLIPNITGSTTKRQTKHGSTNIQALAVNEAIIFVDSVARKIREYTFSDPKQKFVSPDLTALAENITSGGITSMAVQVNPDSIVWFTIADSPYLISMTYEREQNVVAFAEHPLGGDGIAESISITPSTAEDVITLSVKRIINGAVVRTIEQMQPRKWSGTDYYYVDAGVIDTSGSTTITGLDHLEGKTVQVLVDGAKQCDKTVLSGQVTIDKAGTRVVVGLSSEYRVSPMRLDRDGSTYGTITKISEVVVSFFETLNAEYGDGTRQYDIDWRTIEDYGSPPELFTGDKTLTFDGGFTTDSPLTISGSDPFPCTVRALIPKIDKTGR
jgi:hypothetical protein